jgi:hypothetical protein
MERESALASENRRLEKENRAMHEQAARLPGRPRHVQVTEQKLQDARRMLEERLINDADFPRIKGKYLEENFGLRARDDGSSQSPTKG